jgi:hypothetical protein
MKFAACNGEWVHAEYCNDLQEAKKASRSVAAHAIRALPKSPKLPKLTIGPAALLADWDEQAKVLI